MLFYGAMGREKDTFDDMYWKLKVLFFFDKMVFFVKSQFVCIFYNIFQISNYQQNGFSSYKNFGVLSPDLVFLGCRAD